MTRPSSPYPGPRPFEIDERKKFFGREREAREIISLIIAHPTVLLYAESGAGKTSLLNARIIPLLRDRGADVIGATRVSGELPPSVTAADVGNIFTFHAIHGLDNAPPPPPRAGEDASAAPAAMAPDPRTRTRTTLREYVLARPRQPRREGEIVPPRVILFDQFEEVFTTSQARWADRGAFFEDLGDTLDADPNLRIVFVMREEYVAALDPFAAALPRRLRTRYRLERLRKEAAVLAVTEPLKGTGYTLSTEAAETLVENLMRVPGESTVAPASPTGEAPADRAAAGGAAERHVLAETVEPVQLQVVCVQIWDSLPPPPAEIDVERIKTYGDVDRALTSYYEQSICNALTCDVAIENGVTESALRNWFEQALITADGTRGTVYRGAEKTGELPTRLVELLDIRFRLVRPELRGTATWYELTHDRFIAPIRESNRRYFLEQTSGAALAAMLQGRANLW
ncbi:MAG TPA: ATP-binding protein, partial [Longimicrobium sp.]|nr:ATP-binding protein [Longimicrobium sp.]